MDPGYLMRHSLFATEDGTGFRVLLEQAAHEIHKGSFDIGLQYLNKALTVMLHSDNQYDKQQSQVVIIKD